LPRDLPATISVTIVGPAMIPALAELVKWISTRSNLTIVDHLAEIPASASALDSQIIIVLQAYSDQYGTKTVNRLIEQTIGTRLLCCYGPLCASDGRSHDIWPPALRIPVEKFREFLQLETDRIDSKQPPLPPTASGEELFARWFGPAA
jgi:hypothetical protein